MQPALSVILPLYNEGEMLAGAISVVQTFSAVRPEVRFLFVSDGSIDRTAEILRERLGAPWGHGAAQGGAGGVGYIAYERNAGKGEAIRRGIQAVVEREAERAGPAVQEHLVVFMDGDMAYGLDHLDEMIAALRTHEVVIGSRRESPEERRNTRKFRRLSGWCFNRLVRVGLALPYQDTQAGLKGFRLSAAKAIFERVTLSGFAFDVEVLFIARRLGYRIAEIPARVSRAHRKKPSNVNMLREPARMAGNLLKIRWNQVRGRYR